MAWKKITGGGGLKGGHENSRESTVTEFGLDLNRWDGKKDKTRGERTRFPQSRRAVEEFMGKRRGWAANVDFSRGLEPQEH